MKPTYRQLNVGAGEVHEGTCQEMNKAIDEWLDKYKAETKRTDFPVHADAVRRSGYSMNEGYFRYLANVNETYGVSILHAISTWAKLAGIDDTPIGELEPPPMDSDEVFTRVSRPSSMVEDLRDVPSAPTVLELRQSQEYREQVADQRGLVVTMQECVQTMRSIAESHDAKARLTRAVKAGAQIERGKRYLGNFGGH